MTRLLGATLFVFLTILALFFGVGMLVLTRFHLSVPLLMAAAAGFSLIVVLLQFALGPAIIDWVVKIRWADPRELGPDFAQWLDGTCRTFRIPTPRFGVIEEAAPNAFTYGHGAYDARVVVTRGLIDTLTPDELRAVVAHELGHIKHRDFIVMTAIQALVLAMYALYLASRGGNRNGGWYVVVASYVAYWVSYYASLYLSRVREYMADYASAQITGRPNDLAVALVKIAYGLAHTQTVASAGATVPTSSPYAPRPYPGQPVPAPAPVASRATARRGSPVQGIRLDDPSTWPSAPGRPAPTMATPAPVPVAAPVPAPRKDAKAPFSAGQLGAFGVMGLGSMRAAVAWTGANGLASPDNFVQAARWELFNPWAKVAEVLSTHPLTALRIRALQRLNPLFGQPDAYDFSKVRPARYRGFVPDLLLFALPTLFSFLGVGVAALFVRVHPDLSAVAMVPLLFLMGLLLGNLVQLACKYPSDFTPSAVLRLLGEMDVSPIRCKPIALEGTFTGRLQAGISWASDYVFQDATGHMACLYRPALGILRWSFGLFLARQYVGRPVRVYGWYRRFGAPYVELSHFQLMDTGEVVRTNYLVTVAILNILGLVLLSGLLFVVVR